MSQSKKPPRLSVVINNYNYGRYVEECIESVLNQTRRADEIIIVDDGSTDNSVEVIGKFEGSVILLTQPNRGQLGAMMTGVDAATGDILLFLDSDDMWNSDHLETVEKTFAANPSVDCLFTSLQMFGNDEGPHELNFRKAPNRIKRSRIIVHYLNVFFGRPTSACAFKSEIVKKVIQACRGLEEDFRICADKLMIDGSSLIGADKLFIDECTVRYRTHGNNGYYTKGETPEEIAKRRALAAHRKKLIVEKIQNAYPFKINPAAVVHEMMINGYASMYFMFYRKIPDRMKLSYLGEKLLKWRLRSLKSKLARMNGRKKI